MLAASYAAAGIVGVVATELTLRVLDQMCAARLEALGGLAAWEVAMLVGHMPFVNARLDPKRINPFRRRDPAVEAKIEAVKAFIAARGLAAFGEQAAAEPGAGEEDRGPECE